MPISKNVAILGASDKSDRYSYKAMALLKQKGHIPLLIHPSLTSIEGEKVYSKLGEISVPIDTLTMYVKKEISDQLINEIVHSSPKRVIFNPGSENPELTKVLNSKGIKTENACTLVLLTTEQF